MDIRPIGDRILCQRLGFKQETTKGGLHIPVIAQELSPLGLVLSTGADANTRIDPLTGARTDVFEAERIESGDIVWIGAIGGVDVDLQDGRALVILRRHEVIGVLVLTDAQRRDLLAASRAD